MATANRQGLPPQPGHHQRTKSSVLRSFMMHRRNNSQGDGLTPAALVAGGQAPVPGPLEETSHNRQQPQLQGQAEKHAGAPATAAASSPTKKKKLARDAALAALTGGGGGGGSNSSSSHKENETMAGGGAPLSPTKKTRTRSTTNLVGLLSRPKSLRNLHKMAKDAEAEARGPADDRDGQDGKERGRGRGRAAEPDATAAAQVPPIYAQFCSASKAGGREDVAVHTQPVPAGEAAATPSGPKWSAAKPRPKSYHPSSSTPQGVVDPHNNIDAHLEALLDRRNIPEHQRYKMRNLADAIKMELIRQDWAEERSKRQPQPQQQAQQPQLLPSNRPQSHDSARSSNSPAEPANGPSPDQAPSADAGSSGKASKSKHSRVKSLTLSKVTRGRSRDRGSGDSGKRPKSPGLQLKKRAEGTLGRHLRSKSTESFVFPAGSTSGATSPGAASPADSAGDAGANAITGFFSKAKGPQQTSPADFVMYLRTVQAPEKVEVGKLHKLRLLLRNETVAWTEDFIGQGGMAEVVGLLHRILAVEWREEHEDALLHEDLLCLKALCTTALALQYLHAIHASLLPALIHMIFDPEKKGPSEFTTRNIVTWVLFTYIQNAPAHERPERAQTVLGYLRDPERDEEARPVSFVLDMRKDRPYRVWCKEVVNVTKEVFWIFLHHLNVVSLPAAAKEQTAPSPGAALHDDSGRTGPPVPPKHLTPATVPASSYMHRHFPQERPPVPAAPYVGGVEWEATNYLASHLDLVNAILACTPTAAERNQLRGQMQMSGWERCMGGSLRLCKEKFYGAVHDGLRVWVAAAYEDGWDVRDVRFGPPPPPATPATAERRSPKKKAPGSGDGGPGTDDGVPKLEIPKLDFLLDGDGL